MSDSTVLVSRNLARTEKKFHTNPDCPNVPSRAREWTLERADRYDLEECKMCSGDFETTPSTKSHYNALRAAAKER